jgi:cell division protein FtsW (lipid II flippase)
MQDLPDRLAPLIGHQATMLFSVLLVIHVLAGMTSVATGAIAALSPKRRGRHPAMGRVYFWALAVVFVTSTLMSALRWTEDAYLFVLGTLAFGCAVLGLTARRQRWRGWITVHILGMSSSYIVLLTAFYVDNGPRLPLWKELPSIAFWIGPTLIGVPIVARALRRHPRIRRDLRELFRMRCCRVATFTKTH